MLVSTVVKFITASLLESVALFDSWTTEVSEGS